MANEFSDSDRDHRDSGSDGDSDSFYDNYLEFAESGQESPRSCSFTKLNAFPSSHNHDDANNNNVIEDVHNNSNNVVVDESFKRTYFCYPISYLHKEDHLEKGNKVILPASALDSLVSMELEFPMMFKISKPSSNQVSHCGVLEFTAEEGTIFIPNWMMTNLRLAGGEILNVENTRLSKGTYMKIQPHSGEFLSNLSNPKHVLEQIFKDFSCLTLGDTIMVDHENQHYHIDIVETKPNKAISLFETDCEVDFAQPLDYKEPKPTTTSLIKPNVEIINDGAKLECIGFKPFTGMARRLDGQPCVVQPIVKESTCCANKKAATLSSNDDSKFCSRKRVGKVVFSKDDEDDIKEDTKNNVDVKKFQAFTGKKYSLLG